MNYTFTIPNLPGGIQITCTAESETGLIEEAYFWQSLPTVCPIDGTPTIFDYRDPKGNKYYGLVSTGYPAFRYPIRQHKETPGLYTKDEWFFYDGQREDLVWANGKLTPAGERVTAGVKETPTPSRNAPQRPPTSAEEAKRPAPQAKAQPQAEHSRLDGLIGQLADLLYGDTAAEALAAICRLHTEQKRSRLEELSAEQKGGVLASLRLRQKLHSMAAERWGEKSPGNIQRNVLRITDDFTDTDAEISDEQVETLIHGIVALNAKDAENEKVSA